MLLTLRVTEYRKHTSSVATYRALRNAIDRAVDHQRPPTADQLMTTPRTAAPARRLTGRRNFGLFTEGF